MLTYFISDIHADAWLPLTKNESVLRPELERMYDRYFHPADAVSLSGDIADDSTLFLSVVKFLAEKYSRVFLTLGNHELAVSDKFVIDDAFDDTESKIAFLKERLSDIGNVHLLDGDVVEGFGGTMGMCDFSFQVEDGRPYDSLTMWSRAYHDGRCWKYMNQDPLAILKSEREKISGIVELAPKVVLTHFFPVQMGVHGSFAENEKTAFYCFDASEYLESLPESTIWQCGHTHNIVDTTWVDKNNKGHRIICNPLGLPSENNGFNFFYEEKKFLINIC